MDEIEIKRHSFELAKNRLKEFSEKTEDELEIDKVETDGGFLWLFDHKVTGYELNKRLEKIQGNFVAVNTINNKVIKEFKEIYNALDVLDKDYIASIVANVKAIEKTSNDVRRQQGTLKKHNEKLEKQQNKLNQQQFEIKQQLEKNNQIMNILNSFRKKLEEYEHLTDIDKIWNDCKTIQNETQIVSDRISKFLKKITDDIASVNNKNKSLSEQVNRDIFNIRNETQSYKDTFSDLTKKIEATADLLDNQIQVIKEISVLTERLKNVIHISDVDSMWDDIINVKENSETIENSIKDIDADIVKMQENIYEIKSFIDVLNGYEHLQDIDKMWGDLNAITTNIKDINDDIKGNKEDIQTHQSIIKRLEHENNLHKNKLNELLNADDEMRKSISSNVHEINCLKEYKDNLEGILHLYDVDIIWKDVEKHTSLLNESEKRDEELSVTIQKNKEELDKNISDSVQTSKAAIESLTKKVKYAYYIAGGAAGLAIIELVLLLI